VTSEVTEVLLPGVAEAVAGLLDVPEPVDGVLPLMWHWFFCLERPRTVDLGADGHPTSGGPVDPPGAGRRRMWAGGEVRCLGPLRLGEPATRRSSAREPVTKEGRSGRLEFVSVDHEVVQGGRVVVTERQDLVYRDVPPLDGPPPEAEPVVPVPLADGDRPLGITPPLLFRFSALTYNGHRIHYDRDHARHTEGYPGLLTHGPLQALAMAEAARAAGLATEPGTTCRYRLVSPLFDHQGLVARADRDGPGLTATVRDLGGRTTARAEFVTG
jgi:3-methylfumaryl-CoA hydratase